MPAPSLTATRVEGVIPDMGAGACAVEARPRGRHIIASPCKLYLSTGVAEALVVLCNKHSTHRRDQAQSRFQTTYVSNEGWFTRPPLCESDSVLLQPVAVRGASMQCHRGCTLTQTSATNGCGARWTLALVAYSRGYFVNALTGTTVDANTTIILCSRHNRTPSSTTAGCEQDCN